MNTPAMQIDWWLGSPLGLSAGLPRLWAGWVRILAVRQSSADRASAQPAPAWIGSVTGEDRHDVQGALAGDGEAYGRLVRRYQQEIAAYMWRFTRDRLQWEELVHEVFVEAYFSLRTYRAEAPLGHWLRRIATRVGYRWWKQVRRRRHQTALSTEAWQQVIGSDPRQSDVAEAAAAVHALLAEMSPRDRLVLTLVHLEQCTTAEAARLTGWSQTMVKVQAHRARKRLKRLLDQKESQL